LGRWTCDTVAGSTAGRSAFRYQPWASCSHTRASVTCQAAGINLVRINLVPVGYLYLFYSGGGRKSGHQCNWFSCVCVCVCVCVNGTCQWPGRCGNKAVVQRASSAPLSSAQLARCCRRRPSSIGSGVTASTRAGSAAGRSIAHATFTAHEPTGGSRPGSFPSPSSLSPFPVPPLRSRSLKCSWEVRGALQAPPAGSGAEP